MNKYQKIALLVGVVLLVLLFGKTVTQVGLRAIGSLVGLMWKFVLVAVVIVLVISFLKKVGRRK